MMRGVLAQENKKRGPSGGNFKNFLVGTLLYMAPEVLPRTTTAVHATTVPATAFLSSGGCQDDRGHSMRETFAVTAW